MLRSGDFSADNRQTKLIALPLAHARAVIISRAHIYLMDLPYITSPVAIYFLAVIR